MNSEHTYSVDEVAKILGISRNLAYQSANRGDFPVIRLGGRILVPRIAFDKWLSPSSDLPPSNMKNEGE